MKFPALTLNAAVAVACLLTSTAHAAAVISFTDLKGTWSNANPAANIDSNSGTGALASVRWGNSGSANSGYDFQTVGTASVSVPPSPSNIFNLGTFTHINQPVFESINSIRLTVGTELLIDSASQGLFNFVYDFFHDETTNNARPCAYGGANNQGINVNGCADRVTTAFNTTSQTFTVGSDVYTIDVIGFKLGNDPVKNEFLTLENATNTAILQAQVKLRSEVNVPEPGTLSLIGLSMVLLGAGGLKRRAL